MTLGEKVDKMLQGLARMEERFDAFEGTLSEHHTDLNGNGKAGVKMDVDRLKTFKTVACWFLGVICVSCIGIGTTMIYEVIKKW